MKYPSDVPEVLHSQEWDRHDVAVTLTSEQKKKKKKLNQFFLKGSKDAMFTTTGQAKIKPKNITLPTTAVLFVEA